MLKKLRLKWAGSPSDQSDSPADVPYSNSDAWDVLNGSTLPADEEPPVLNTQKTIGTQTTETVTFPGSGIVFQNTYEPTVSSAYHAAIVQAENFFQAHFSNPVTVTIDFNLKPLSGGNSGQNSFYISPVSYSQLVAALRSRATTSDDLAAVNSLPASDPSGGKNFAVPVGVAGILGLGNPASYSMDDTVSLNSDLAWAYNQDAIGVLEHEISEGIFGRISYLGAFNNEWAALDLFRYSAPGARDYTGGSDGKPAFFSVNGQTLLTKFHNSNGSAGFDGEDLGDWDGTVGDAFGPGGPGFPGTVTATDLRVLDILGWTPTTSPTVRSVARDFNADGKSDILWQDDSGDAATWNMDGASVIGSAGLGNPGPSWQPISTADFTGDGKSDILWQNTDGTDGTVSIWEMDNASIIGSATYSPGASWRAIGAGDFNGDAAPDILWQNTDGTAAIWLMSGTLPSGAQLGNPGPSWHAVGAGNFNGDGKSDILWQNTDGRVVIWQMNGVSVSGGAELGNPGPSWHPIATGDFNGDGKSDILWQNTSGEVEIWQMDGISLATGISLGNPGAAWHAIATGDYNGDGKSDILWQNTDGEVEIWQMDGSSIVGGTSLGNPGTNWHVIGNNRMSFMSASAVASDAASQEQAPSAATAAGETTSTAVSLADLSPASGGSQLLADVAPASSSSSAGGYLPQVDPASLLLPVQTGT